MSSMLRTIRRNMERNGLDTRQRDTYVRVGKAAKREGLTRKEYIEKSRKEKDARHPDDYYSSL